MTYLIVVIALCVVLVVVGGLFFLRPGRRRGAPPEAPPAPPAEEQRAGPGVTGEAGATGTIAPEAPLAPRAPPAPEIEKPPPSAGRMVRLRARLARSQGALGSVLLGLLSRDALDDEAWEQIEDTLITADVGVAPSRQITDDLRVKVKVVGTRSRDEVRAMLKAELLAQIGTSSERALHLDPRGGRPAVVLMVGVNGTGKTTTCGKLARVLVGDDRTVLLGAADTFRAAAVDQLQTWGARVGARVVRSEREGADPASVAYEAVREGIEAGVDVVIVDTAGCTPRPA